MIIINVLIIITGILAALTSYYYLKKSYAQRVLYKTLSSTGFIFIAIFALLENNEVSLIYSGGILIALIFGLVGDMLLSLHPFLDKKEGNFMNIAGSFSFLLGHLVYISIFTYYVGFRPISLIYIAIIPLIIILLIKLKVLYPNDKNFAVIVYATMISFMLVQGVCLHNSKIFDHSTIILIACILFFLSDLILTFYNFSKYKLKYMMPICLILYYCAQVLFAYSIALY